MMFEKGMDVHSILEEAYRNGLRYALDAGTHPADTEKRIQLTAGFPWVLLSAGIYPGGSEGGYLEELLWALEERLKTKRFSAVGEIGIDFHWNYATPEQQRQLFAAQIELANRYELPVIIHNRKADSAVLEVLESTPPEYGGVMHCFSSDKRTARQCLDFGLFISFAGNVTYKNADMLRDAAGSVPLDSILVETDAPFLSPEPLRGKKNHPGYIINTYEFLATLLKVDSELLQKRVTENYLRLFT